ncbi:MAG TPA: NUDIX hydrolase [Verrucomicrobiae bacterium]|nr:NUDIX hydrolase [Verrucomicrobiae bacterium]
MKRGPYTITSTQDVYANPWIRIHEDKIVRPNGKDGIYGIVEYSGGVTTVAINDKHEVYLVKEYHYAVDENGITLPGGGIDKNESPLDAAKRELREESGVVAKNWIELGTAQPLPMIVNNTEYLFLATGAEIQVNHEEEFILLTVSFDEAFEMVINGKIKHAASCIAILKAKEYVSKE